MPQIRFVQGVVAIAFMSFAGTRDAIGKNAGSAGAATGGPETIRQQQPDFLVRATWITLRGAITRGTNSHCG